MIGGILQGSSFLRFWTCLRSTRLGTYLRYVFALRSLLSFLLVNSPMNNNSSDNFDDGGAFDWNYGTPNTANSNMFDVSGQQYSDTMGEY